MSRIYDALENRDNEINYRAAVAPGSLISSDMEISADPYGMEQEMFALYQTIAAALPDKQHRSVLLVGARAEEGTSTMARELAKTVSTRVNKRVLLVDCEGSCDEFSYPGIDPSIRFEDIFATGMDIDKIICPVNSGNLSIFPFFLWARSPFVQTAHIENCRGFWDSIMERFDFVVIDYPQEMLNTGPAIASLVDGAVIVVEAEKTRWQVALNVKERIIKSGGNVLGVIFNKRQHYIPKAIYDLF
ncbi:MAG: P-loop NTPase family protein [Syntrophorhabdaceae bacterium]